MLDGRDMMGLAQTGTGKTAAFGLPLIQMLLPSRQTRPGADAHPRADPRPDARTGEPDRRQPARLHPRDAAARRRVVGGASISKQMQELARGTDILVATPGRLLDLIERRAVILTTAKFLVLDEADQMLDLGFIHSLRRIAKMVPTPRQTLLFSATMPKQIEELSQTYPQPIRSRVEVSPPGKAADKVDQSVHFVGQRRTRRTC